jgi:hypothetical protein
MALGFSFNGSCYPDSASAVDAVSTFFPRLDSGQLISIGQPYFSAPNNVYFWITSQNVSTGAITGVNGGFTLTTCNVPLGSVFDPVLAGQLWMFALTIILGCWVLAKNAGLILEAIRRW